MHKIFLDIKKGPRYWYKEVVKAKMAPEEIAMGFGMGVFCTMLALPIINLFIALAAMAFLRVNKIAVMLGYVTILFPLSPLVYYFSLKTGFYLFGYSSAIPSMKDITLSVIWSYGLPFIIGNLALSILSAFVSSILVYFVARLIETIEKRRSTQTSLLK